MSLFSLFPALLRFAPGGALLLLAGCQTASFLERADEETYRIVEDVRGREETGIEKKEPLSIETPFSKRSPASLPPEEIIQGRSQRESLPLAIEEAISLGIQSSREYQSQRESLYLTALTYSGQRHRFRPQKFFSGRPSQRWQPRDSPADPGTSELLLEGDANLGFTQAFQTGTEFAVNVANDVLRYYTGDPRRSAVSAVTINLVQPLLRGAGRKVAAEQLTQSFRDVVYQVRDYSHFQSEFVRDVVVSYFRLLQNRDSVFNAYSDYESRLNATEYLLARSVDRENPLDVKQAEQAELSAKNRYIDSVARYRNAVDDFKIRLGIPLSTDLQLDKTELDDLRKVGLIPLELPPDQAVAIALDRRLPLLNEIDRFDDAKRRILVAADALEGEVTLISNATFLSDEPLNFLDFHFSDLQANVAIQIDLPVNKKQERNAYRTTLIRFEEEIRSLSLTVDRLYQNVERFHRQLEQFTLNYEIQQAAVEQARLRVEGARLRLAAGTAI
ncbi:MAG: TolC family protein, partial [Verrucomicrobiota bacterium]